MRLFLKLSEPEILFLSVTCGFHAAVCVCEATRAYHRYTERAWHRIGQWEA